MPSPAPTEPWQQHTTFVWDNAQQRLAAGDGQARVTFVARSTSWLCQQGGDSPRTPSHIATDLELLPVPSQCPSWVHCWLLSLDTAMGTLAVASPPSFSVLLLRQTLLRDALGCELSQDIVQVVDVRVTVAGEVGAKLRLVVDLIPYHCV